MKERSKWVRVTVSLDEETGSILRKLADVHNEGNASRTARDLLRDAARQSGGIEVRPSTEQASCCG